jgi:hypothetical protein
MPRRRLSRWFLFATPLLCAPTAWAQAQDAATLQRDLRAWLVGFLAPVLSVPESSLRVTAVGDGFDLNYTLNDKNDQSARLRLTPLTDGRWRVDLPRLPKIGEFVANPALNNASIAYAINEVDALATIDPSLRTGSTGRIEAHDIVVASRSADGDQTQRIKHYVLTGAVMPLKDGGLEVTQDAVISDWRSHTALGGGAGTAINEVGRADLTLRVDGLRTERVGAFFASTKAAIATVMAAKPDDPSALTPAMRAELRAMILSMRDLATRFEAVETLHDFTGKIPNLGGFRIGKARIGLGAEVPDDKLRAWVVLGVEGVEVEGLPKEWASFIPDRIEMRPVMIGVRTEGFVELLLRSLDEAIDGERFNKDVSALLTKDDAWVGIESLLIDFDPLRLEGSGRLRVLEPGKPTIEARITAAGLDQLMLEMVRKPDMGLLVPIVAMAKGLGRQEGERMVWDITLTDSQAIINGVDMLAKPAEPPPRRPNRR